ncbi:MAG: peptidylprolyl isomerase [Cytophagales bacterium]|nr:peptidylprolyl isomerase [Cytophagales bacterium]
MISVALLGWQSVSAQTREVDAIVALVNSEPIMRSEVQQRQSRLMAQWAAERVSVPPAAEVYQRVLDGLIEERVILQLGKDAGFRITDTELNEALLGIARQNNIASLRALQSKYEGEGGNWNQYREEIRDELMRQQVREREVDARVRVTESEIDQVMKERSLLSSAAPDINMAQILIALPDSPSAVAVAEAKQKAQQVVAQVRAGADFSRLAMQLSDAMDKTRGGVMGLRSADRYPQLFVDSVRDLKVGAVSDPIRSDAGFHILKLLERSANAGVMTTETQVRHILLPITGNQTEAQAKVRLATYKAQIEQGRTTFAALAREYSTDSSAVQGGDLGWVAAGLFVPEFERVMNALPVGKLSEPFTSRFGVHLVEVTNRREVAMSVREQRARVQNQLREKKAAEAYVLWLSEARARAFVEYKNAAL